MERPLPALRSGAAAAVALAVMLSGLAGWELHWRGFGARPSYRNSEGLWAEQRRRISEGEGGATVLIGSSRMLSNLQLPVWERLEGRRPIQLSLEGTSPMIPLQQLADEAKFTGRLLVGVTPGLFFSGYAYRGSVFEYFAKETPSQRAGQWLSMTLIEPVFAFYDPDFALFTILARQPWPVRPGMRPRMEVRKIFHFDRDRNARLWDRLERDAEYQALAKRIWAQRFDAPPPPPAVIKQMLAARQKQIDDAVPAVGKLRARGVEVVFVRHPSDGRFLEFERKVDPRQDTWDVLIARTGARGVHFEDHPELQGYHLPEWSHLSASEADRYTEALYRLLLPRAPAAGASGG